MDIKHLTLNVQQEYGQILFSGYVIYDKDRNYFDSCIYILISVYKVPFASAF